VLYFEANARSRPHTHDTDQITYFTQGPGVIAIAGEDDQRVETGLVVRLPAHVPHMHGAPEWNPAVHISLMPPGHHNDFECPIPDHWRQWRELGRSE
jgi:quercetin dioxygenase-like cupin family protein